MKGWNSSNKFDYSNVTTDAPKPLDPGLYRARIVEAVPQPTKEGKPMIKLTSEVFQNENGDEIPKRKLIDNMVLSQAALFRVKIVAEALDIEPLGGDSLEETEEFCKNIVTACRDQGGVWLKVVHRKETKKDGNPEDPNDQIVRARIDRYLSEDAVKSTPAKKEASASKSNGAASEAAPAAERRPRPAATPTA